MTKLTLALLVITAACDKKPAGEPATKPAPSGDPVAIDANLGLDGAGIDDAGIDAAAPDAPDAAPDAAIDPLEDLAKRYEACVRADDRCGWKLRRDVSYDVGFLLVTKDQLFAVLRLGGTTVGHSVAVSARGDFTGAKTFDHTRGTAQSGFPRKVVRLAKGESSEQANLDAFAKLHKKAKPARAAGDYVAGIDRKELVIRRFENGTAAEIWTYE